MHKWTMAIRPKCFIRLGPQSQRSRVILTWYRLQILDSGKRSMVEKGDWRKESFGQNN